MLTVSRTLYAPASRHADRPTDRPSLFSTNGAVTARGKKHAAQQAAHHIKVVGVEILECKPVMQFLLLAMKHVLQNCLSSRKAYAILCLLGPQLALSTNVTLLAMTAEISCC